MRLSRHQLQALAALSPVVMRQLADLGAADRTLQSLCKRQLARRVELKPATWLKEPYHTFYLLTAAGAAQIGSAA